MDTQLPASIEAALTVDGEFTPLHVRLIAETAYCMGRLDGMLAIQTIDRERRAQALELAESASERIEELEGSR